MERREKMTKKIKLPSLNRYVLAKPIQLRRFLSNGFFTHNYEYKEVSGYEDALVEIEKGWEWFIPDYQIYFNNVAIAAHRALNELVVALNKERK